MGGLRGDFAWSGSAQLLIRCTLENPAGWICGDDLEMSRRLSGSRLNLEWNCNHEPRMRIETAGEEKLCHRWRACISPHLGRYVARWPPYDSARFCGWRRRLKILQHFLYVGKRC